MNIFRNVSVKTRLAIYIGVLTTIGFIIICSVSIKTMSKKVTDAMVNEFINQDTQIAHQAAIIQERGGGVEELQAFVDKLIADNPYIAYAVYVDLDVKALAHSDHEKIDKSYADDTGYTVPAATQGVVMTSKFWADVQKAWTYDVMCPVYVNGKIQGLITQCVSLMENGNDSVKQGITYAQKAEESFTQIKEKITSVSDEMATVSAVTEEAAKSQEELMHSVVREVDELVKISTSLEKSLAKFKLDV